MKKCKFDVYDNRKGGFTLAEVLVTMTIIGIVAVLTFGILIPAVKDSIMMTSLKRIYSDLMNATKMIIEDYGEPGSWNLQNDNEERAKFVRNIYKSHFRVSRSCDSNNTSCFVFPVKYHSDSVSADDYKNWKLTSMTLNNGTNIMFDINQSNFAIHVDLNGMKKPNEYGKDVFVIMLGLDGKLMDPSTVETNDGGGTRYSHAYKIIKNGWKK